MRISDWSSDVCSSDLTDQTSAHDPLNGYLPAGWTWNEYRARAKTEPAAVVKAAKQSMAIHVKAMLAFQKMGVPTFDYGNHIRQMAQAEIGRASCRERVFPYVSISVVARSLKKKNI